MNDIRWLTRELGRQFKDADLKVGIDLDKNGKVEGAERTDLNNNGVVDPNEWQKFLTSNEALLKRQTGGFLNFYYVSGRSFKPDNPIHDILSMESEAVSPDLVKNAYEKVDKILKAVKKELAGKRLTPRQKVELVYKVMKDAGITYENSNRDLFSRDIKEGILDCDTSSFVVFAVAHELGWPLHLVRVPKHTFVRWDDGHGTRFNMDFGESHDDSEYKTRFNMDDNVVSRGVYLRNQTHAENIAYLYSMRGVAYYKINEFQKALRDYDTAAAILSESSPPGRHDPQLYSNRGSAKQRLGRFNDAIEDCNRSLGLDPRYASAYANRAAALTGLGKDSEAIRDCDRAIELDPKDAMAFSNRGAARQHLGKNKEAIEDFNKALELDPGATYVYRNRAAAYVGLGENQKALEDGNKAVELNPDDPFTYANRAAAFYGLGRFRDAIDDCNKAIEHSPGCLQAYQNRALAEYELGLYREAVSDCDVVIRSNPKGLDAYRTHVSAKIGMKDLQGAIVDLDKMIELEPKDAAFLVARGLVLLELGNREAAKKDFKKALELEPGNIKASIYLARTEDYQKGSVQVDLGMLAHDHRLRRYVFPFYAGLQARYRFAGDDSIDGRLSAGAEYPAVSFSPNKRLGPQIEAGYGTNGHYNIADASAGLAFMYDSNLYSLTADGGAGYNFRLAGDDASAPIRSGSFFRYGLHYDRALGPHFRIGGSFSVHHEMKEPGRFAIVPGLDVKF